VLTPDTPLRIATSRYAAGSLIVESGLAPVATSRGLPKFPIAYPLATHLLELAPTWPQMQLEPEHFEGAYLRQLERIGIEQVMGRLAEIAATTDTEGCVLLCFEPAGEFCHRRLLAAWLEEQIGRSVPELTEPPSVDLTIGS
jgi:hypothetical protein